LFVCSSFALSFCL